MHEADANATTGGSTFGRAPLDRRNFLALAGAGILSVSALAVSAGRASASGLDRDPFTLGVASGDALHDRVVLWTRLAPEPLSPQTGFGMAGISDVIVRWRVAAGESGLASPELLIASGQVTATAVRTVDVTGLQAGGHYVYQFEVDGPDGELLRSPVGHTRTARAADDASPVRFAVVTCQNLARADGGEFFFHGHEHLAARDDIDFVVFLGDYFYEFGRDAHVPPREVTSLDDYRTRYSQYKMRLSLQEVHRRFPVYVMPDDHEFWNDYKGGNLGAVANIRRFNGALQALWENMPLRGGHPGAVADTKNNYTLHRQVRWGSMLDMFVADVRQYRGPSLLGTAQANQIQAWLRATTATWTTVATPTPMWWNDSASGWNAFTGIRNNVTTIFHDRKAATPDTFNPVVLSGDIHCGIVTHVRRTIDHTSDFVATEFINAPMTSQASNVVLPDGEVRAAYNGRYGYMVCSADPVRWTTQYVIGDETEDPSGSAAAGETWRLDAGAAAGSVHLGGPDPVVPEVSAPVLLGVTAVATIGTLAAIQHRRAADEDGVIA